METEPKKTRTKGGRPRKYASDEKRPTMAFRIRGGMHEKLVASAQARDVSLSEEIERRLGRSFDMEAEISAKDRYIAALKHTDRVLWPDEGAQVLGQAFAMALSAVRYTGGKDWRDDDAVPAIMAGVVRRIVDHCNRTHGASSTVYEVVYPQRIASTVESVSASLSSFLDDTMPALPPLQPQDEPSNWTSRARPAVVFRDRRTGDLAELVEGAEYDVAEHEAAAEFPAECSAAVMKYAPQREMVDAESFTVLPLKDGSAAWYSVSRPGRVFVIPEGQGAPPAFEPALIAAEHNAPPAAAPPHPAPADPAPSDPAPKRRGRPRKAANEA